jgi:hypothetical protein
MTEWINCKDKLPPRYIYVKVSSAGREFIANRVGWFFNWWKFKSGLTEGPIVYWEKWRLLDKDD